MIHVGYTSCDLERDLEHDRLDEANQMEICIKETFKGLKIYNPFQFFLNPTTHHIQP